MKIWFCLKFHVEFIRCVVRRAIVIYKNTLMKYLQCMFKKLNLHK